ncbi:unnamed protein product, partial [Ectocarpus sp. 12 AP-2014]
PWSAQDFADLLGKPGVFLISERAGFALGRTVLDEVELLTLAVAPGAQRSGSGTRLLAEFEHTAQNHGATRAFLEVAITNTAAKALYAGAGWRVDGVRAGYYRAKPAAIDAALMSKALLIP